MAMIAEFLAMQLLVLSTLLTLYGVLERRPGATARDPVYARPSLRVVSGHSTSHLALRA